MRVFAADRLGFGDAEALYACYARHPQPVYLDHPGLIGVFARVVGGGDAPSPQAAHHATAILATIVPWVAALAARAAGASWAGAVAAAVALIAAPEIGIGLFGMTPDLLLVLLWYAALAAAAAALRARAGSFVALAAALAAGLAVGLACDAKASGALLLVGLAVGFASRPARVHLRTLAPWAGLALALIVVSPVVVDEIERGFPMLQHRLGAAPLTPSLRNVAALVGGQLLYVGPVLLVCALRVARDLWRQRANDAVSWLLASTALASLPLVLLCLLSRIAEPHWVAPLYLALPLHLARNWERAPVIVGRALARASVLTGGLLLITAHAYVLTHLAPMLLGDAYVARYDLANDLYAWRPGLSVVRRALVETAADGPPAIVVGHHWTICAQLHAGLPGSVLVGCDRAAPADFERWLPAATYAQAPTLLYVSDDRFDDASPLLAERRHDAEWHADILRGGRIVRRITVTRLLRSTTSAVTP
jgi:hypothetical protein